MDFQTAPKHPPTKRRHNYAIRDITLTALFAAFTAVCSFLSVPSVIPFTLQTFAVYFSLEMLGKRWGFFSILVYLLIGACGLPVFSGFTGGVSALLGPTGGYLFGFLFMAVLYDILTSLFGRKAPIRAAALVLGTMACYLFGTLWFVHFFTARGDSVTFGAALLSCVVPFLLPDAIKLTTAMILAARLRKLRIFSNEA